MDHHVYLDETGTLDFDDVAGERYFGVGSATWAGHHGEAIWQGHRLRLELEAAGIRLAKGLHATNDSTTTRSQVFELIAAQNPASTRRCCSSPVPSCRFALPERFVCTSWPCGCT